MIGAPVQQVSKGKEGPAAPPRLRPATLVWGLVVLLVLVYLGVGVSLARQAAAAGSLRAEVARLRDPLAQASANGQSLESRLREAQERRAIASALIPSRLGASQVMDRVLESAKRAGVDVLEAKAKAPEQEKAGVQDPKAKALEQKKAAVQDPKAKAPEQEKTDDRVYEAHRYEVTVRGEMQRLLTFLRHLDTETMDTLALRTATLTPSTDALSLSVAFAVYTHPGAAEVASRENAPPITLPPTAAQERARLRAVVDRLWGQGGWELILGLLVALRDSDTPSARVDDMLYQAYIAHGQGLLAAGSVEKGADQFRAALTLRPEGQEAQDGLRKAQEASRGR